jgi:hypothetical protein
LTRNQRSFTYICTVYHTETRTFVPDWTALIPLLDLRDKQREKREEIREAKRVAQIQQLEIRVTEKDSQIQQLMADVKELKKLVNKEKRVPLKKKARKRSVTPEKPKTSRKKKIPKTNEPHTKEDDILNYISLKELQEMNDKIWETGMYATAQWDKQGRIRWKTTKLSDNKGTEYKWKNPELSDEKLKEIGHRLRLIATFVGKAYKQGSCAKIKATTEEVKFWGTKLFRIKIPPK